MRWRLSYKDPIKTHEVSEKYDFSLDIINFVIIFSYINMNAGDEKLILIYHRNIGKLL